jgi:gamma-glutamylcyclotransferase (GGCT)/AIG2-like uncharacterized protein YtfP
LPRKVGSTQREVGLVIRARLFLYGSLMRGESNAAHLAGAIFVAEARTAAGYQLHDLGPYPGMRRGQGQVEGELWLVSPRQLRQLDAFEEHPHRYRRERITLEGGEIAFAYLHCDPEVAPGPRIAGGSWRRAQGR